MAASMMQTDGILNPEGILPSQYFSPRRKETAEQRLMIAVLRDAVDCVRKECFATTLEGRRSFAEAQRWFFGAERAGPYSFESICEVLDLDPNAVRDRLFLVQDLRPKIKSKASGRNSRGDSEKSGQADR